MSLFKNIRRIISNFRRDIRASVTVEAVLIAPFLVWAVVATYVFYDGFRTKTRVQVAANTVVDVISRRTSEMDADDIDALNNVFDALVGTDTPTRLRVTSVARRDDAAELEVLWSHGTRGLEPVAQVAELTSPVPPVLAGETVVVLETFGQWEPPFALLGMDPIVGLSGQVASRPRFAPEIKFAGTDPVFASYNPEWANPDAGYDPYEAGEMEPYTPIDGGGGSGGVAGGGSGGEGGDGDPEGEGGGIIAGGGGSGLGDPSQDLQQVGLWTFDNAFARHRDEAVIANSSQTWGNPQWRMNAGGLYENDGGFWLDNCVAGAGLQRANNGQQNYLHIPWHQDYDLTNATLRMVFELDALPPSANYQWQNQSNNRYLSIMDMPSAWGLFSRDAFGQDEGGHFSSWVFGDGAIGVRYQTNADDWQTDGYYDSNYFVYAPPGTVEPGAPVDMQLTFDHDQRKLDLYVNGDLMDSHPGVNITLAGNQNPWTLGADIVHSQNGTHRDPTGERFMCGTIHHFEVWEGAFSAREVEVMTCGVEPYTEEWFEYFYLNAGRYPLPNEGLAISPGAAAICGHEPTGPANDPCAVQVLYMDRNHVEIPFWVDVTDVQVGDYVIFNNVGLFDDGSPVDVRMRLAAKSSPALDVTFLQSGTALVHLNNNQQANLGGQTIDLTFEFFNRTTGQAVPQSGLITFTDIDLSQGSAERVGFARGDFEDGYASAETDLLRVDDGGFFTFEGQTFTDVNDPAAWATGHFYQRTDFTVRLQSRTLRTGFGITTEQVACVGGEAPTQCTPEVLANLDFEDHQAPGWSRSKTERTDGFTRFLGRFGRDETVTWSNSLPDGTTTLSMAFDLYFTDSWDGIGHGWSGPLGDRLDFMINNQLIGYKIWNHWSDQYRNAETIVGNVGGANYELILTPLRFENLGFSSARDGIWRVTINIVNPPQAFNFGFRAHLDGDINDEAWGVDNFEVTLGCP
jgi:hypothetical protein